MKGTTTPLLSGQGNRYTVGTAHVTQQKATKYFAMVGILAGDNNLHGQLHKARWK